MGIAVPFQLFTSTLTPPNHILNLDQLKEMEDKIRKINTQKYENPQLQQCITNNGNNAALDLRSSNLTDQDMEIVASALKNNTVRYHYSFLPFRVFQYHRSELFTEYTSSF
jgi:hypothetical protein